MLLTIDKDRTYSFHLRARLTLGIVACVVACVCAVIAGIFLILIQAYIALFVPVAWIGCGVAFLLLAPRWNYTIGSEKKKQRHMDSHEFRTKDPMGQNPKYRFQHLIWIKANILVL